jgi:hypothetical protein
MSTVSLVQCCTLRVMALSGAPTETVDLRRLYSISARSRTPAFASTVADAEACKTEEEAGRT